MGHFSALQKIILFSKSLMSSLQNLSWLMWIKVLSDSISTAILDAVPCLKDSGGWPGAPVRMGKGHMETNLQVITTFLLDCAIRVRGPSKSSRLEQRASFSLKPSLGAEIT